MRPRETTESTLRDRSETPRVNGGNDSASWPFPHLSSAPAMDRHPRVDLRDFAESQSTRARETKTATQKIREIRRSWHAVVDAA